MNLPSLDFAIGSFIGFVMSVISYYIGYARASKASEEAMERWAESEIKVLDDIIAQGKASLALADKVLERRANIIEGEVINLGNV